MNESLIRTSDELKEIIDFIRAKCLMEGKKVLSVSEITKEIAKKINKEELYENVFS